MLLQTVVHNVVENLIQEGIDKLNDRVVNLGKQAVLYALEARDMNHNKDVIKAALKSGLDGLLVSIMDGSSGIKGSYESAKI